MVLAKNEFDLLVNAYYQAYGLFKGIGANEIFGKIDLLPEIEYFRNGLKDQRFLYQAIVNSESSGKRGEMELSLLKLKLSEIFGMQDWWFKEIELSIDSYIDENHDMTSYRITFQTASDNLYRFVGAIIPHMDPSINKANAIVDVTNNILNENYWQGEDTLKIINFSRFFRTALNYSDKWIYEYMKSLLRK